MIKKNSIHNYFLYLSPRGLKKRKTKKKKKTENI